MPRKQALSRRMSAREWKATNTFEATEGDIDEEEDDEGNGDGDDARPAALPAGRPSLVAVVSNPMSPRPSSNTSR